jgi:prevent-host-death family protein
MKKASISEAKNGLSRLLERVRRGETILITDRNRPVARLEPVTTNLAAEVKGRLDRLQRAGLVRLGQGGVVESIVSRAAPRAKKGASAVAAILDEREAGR